MPAANAPLWFLDLFSRHPRRLLARPSRTPFPPVPGVLLRTGSVSLLCSPLWPEHRAKGIHKARQCYRLQPSTLGSQGGCLPGRLAHMGKFPRGMRQGGHPYLSRIRMTRLSNKQSEIAPHSSAKLAVAGHPMGHPHRHTFSTTSKTNQHPSDAQDLPEPTDCLQKGL